MNLVLPLVKAKGNASPSKYISAAKALYIKRGGGPVDMQAHEISPRASPMLIETKRLKKKDDKKRESIRIIINVSIVVTKQQYNVIISLTHAVSQRNRLNFVNSDGGLLMTPHKSHSKFRLQTR